VLAADSVPDPGGDGRRCARELGEGGCRVVDVTVRVLDRRRRSSVGIGSTGHAVL
jgi:hypothetical protein